MLSPGCTACGAHPHHHGTAVCCGTGDSWSLSCTSDKRVTERGFSAQLPGALSTPPAVPGARPCTCQGCGAVCSSACYRCSSRKHVGERRPCVPCVPCVPCADLESKEHRAVFQGGCTASLPPAASGSFSRPVSLSLSHPGRWNGVQRRLVCLWVATPAASLCASRAYLLRVKQRLQLVPAFKLSSSFACY